MLVVPAVEGPSSTVDLAGCKLFPLLRVQVLL